MNSVKVIIDRATGVSRGIAFVEFQQLSAAKAFYDHYKQPDQPNSHKILIDGFHFLNSHHSDSLKINFIKKTTKKSS